MDPTRAAVLLDIDGTLVDSTYFHAVAWHRAFERYDVTQPMWRIHRAIGMGGDKLVAHVAGEAVEESHGDEVRAAWREEYLPLQDEVQPLPGAVQLVHALHAQGLRVALASSGAPQFSEGAVNILGVADVVELVVSSDEVAASKPDPDLIVDTLRRMDDVDRALLVGDTVYDVEAANRAGVPCVALCTGGYGREELETAGAVLVVDEPSDLLGISWADHLGPLVASR